MNDAFAGFDRDEASAFIGSFDRATGVGASAISKHGGGHKVPVFSQFVQLLDLLKPVLSARKWPVFCLTGDTENRCQLVSTFHESAGNAVFLISLKAGGFGLNLTAASYVVLFDRWWNPAVETQAIDRTHWIWQSNTVIGYRLLSIRGRALAAHAASDKPGASEPEALDDRTPSEQ
ncbi:MAG TPA: C-terminal helicase domain-containing protein [Verrucomicrobiota bacterium]|jgi:SNF2 family DNA or RNA helicase|nr:C-terminal helicase domain-containing protein [Verrucomicrobiota bacterium]OQC66053.1 MAG: hypothetical protein BWX48_01925 [Verrucomicrobia bacterium ADurb.Bin006]HNV00539.1 C-terminal helicase domain-containing protein [Verrucomicrobiota bacterium]HOA62222.1 C-terminal helicase domain-containing protein [Verrucomicrobiota bacterium]HOF49524.1 C-terminal helicase domain-containing protein [Verrucomicrobiota bacterium]